MIINQQFKTHLEYLGYTMDGLNNNIFNQFGYPTLIIEQRTENRLLLHAQYAINNNATNNEIGFLRYINNLNLESTLVTFYKTSESLGWSAIYTGIYARIEFGQFMKAWEFDSTDLLGNTAETNFFLMDDCPRIESDLMNLAIDKQYQA